MKNFEDSKLSKLVFNSFLKCIVSNFFHKGSKMQLLCCFLGSHYFSKVTSNKNPSSIFLGVGSYAHTTIKPTIIYLNKFTNFEIEHVKLKIPNPVPNSPGILTSRTRISNRDFNYRDPVPVPKSGQKFYPAHLCLVPYIKHTTEFIKQGFDCKLAIPKHILSILKQVFKDV